MDLSVCPQWIFYTRLGGYLSCWRLPFLGVLQKALQQPTKCSCNHLHFCFATTYIFGLQLSTFLFYNKHATDFDEKVEKYRAVLKKYAEIPRRLDRAAEALVPYEEYIE